MGGYCYGLSFCSLVLCVYCFSPLPLLGFPSSSAVGGSGAWLTYFPEECSEAHLVSIL